MGGRIYDPAIRRFLTRDVAPDLPLQVFGTHAYAYVGHDPVNRIDPTGFQTAGYQGQGNSSADCRITGTCPIPNINVAFPEGDVIRSQPKQPTQPPPKQPTQFGPQPTPPAQPAASGQPPSFPSPSLDHAWQQAVMANNEHLTAPGPGTFGPGALGPRHMPGYEYTMRHAIGTTAEGVTSERAIAATLKEPNRIFPFHDRLAWERRAFNPAAYMSCRTCVDPFDNGNFVRVTDVTETSFTFRTLPGHFDGVGATIKFSTHEEGGVVYLQHDGFAPNAGIVQALVVPFGAAVTWTQQAYNLGRAMVSDGGPIPFDPIGMSYSSFGASQDAAPDEKSFPHARGRRRPPLAFMELC